MCESNYPDFPSIKSKRCNEMDEKRSLGWILDHHLDAIEPENTLLSTRSARVKNSYCKK